MRTITYNSQRNNFDFAGKFKGFQQCFSTCAWMLLSFFAPQYTADDDRALSWYVDDVSNVVGKPGIGEIIKAKFRAITGNTAYWWVVQKAGLEKWLAHAEVSGKAVFKDGNCTWSEFEAAIKISPVILQTNKLMGLSGGHIILVVDYDGADLIVNDPYGDANTWYKDKNGEAVRYNRAWLKPFVGGDKLRCMWFEKEA